MNDLEFNVGALDDGYGDIKYNLDGIPKLIPSFVTSFKPKPINNFSSLNSHVEPIYIATKIKDKKYVVGDYAPKLDTNIQWIGGENKHKDDRFPIMLQSALAAMSPNPIQVIDLLAMNLPIGSNTEDRREYLSNLARKHHILDISYNGENFTRKEVIVKDTIIKPQAFGAFCKLILNREGGIKDQDTAKGFNIIVDLGARTMNILTLDALEEVPELTKHDNNGMFVAYENVFSYLKNEHGIVVPDGKIPQVIQKKEIKNIDISPLIEESYRSHANTIIGILEKMFVNTWSFVTSVTFCGGSELLEKHLRTAFSNRNFEINFLNRFANVDGLRLYALRQVKKNQSKQNISVRVGR